MASLPLELSKAAAFSEPRWRQRPASTQKTASETLPDLPDRTHVILNRAVLATTFDDVAGLEVNVLVRNILYRQIIDAAGFVDDDFLVFQRFLKGEVGFARLVRAVDEEQGQVLVFKWLGDGVITGGCGLGEGNGRSAGATAGEPPALSGGLLLGLLVD